MTIEELVLESKTIAVVGISNDPTRSSNSVALRLSRLGFKIIPVNPQLQEWEGHQVYASVQDIPKEITIDIVDVFRRPEFTPDVVRDVIARGEPFPKCIWLQQGILSAEARMLTEDSGIFFIEDACLGVEAGYFIR
jgi:predicted CoA-binding protein